MFVKRVLVKRAFEWTTAVVGITFGLAGLVLSSQADISSLSFHGDDYWPKNWAGFVGIVLFSLTFLTASLIALRNRKRAALIFFVISPFVAFCAAFASAGYLEWHADGGGYFESPFISTALWLALLFFIPFLLPLFAIRNRKRAVFLFLIPALLVSPVFVFSRWTGSFLPELAGWSLLFVAFGSFWLGTHKLGWPPLVSPRPRSLMRRFAAFGATVLLVVFMEIAGTLALTIAGSSLFGECGDRHPFVRPVSPEQIVMTARLIWIGRLGREGIGGKPGLVGIGIVERQYWGPRMQHIVLLTDNVFWKGETYFVEGGRETGLLARFLSIVSTGVCSRTRPLADAEIDLREVNKGSLATNGAQIIGYARKPEPFRSYLNSPAVAHTPMPNAQIRLSGSATDRVITTDRDGIYEIDNLPPDSYTLRLALPDTQFAQDQKLTATEDAVKKSVVFERDFPVIWNGKIDGTVKDGAGGPAKAFVDLNFIDGGVLTGDAKSSSETRPDGSFSLERIPPGRYALIVDPEGPHKESPYPPQAQGVRILDLSPGQRIQGVGFTVHPSVERKLRVRVLWPDGRPVKNATINVAYDRPPGYALPVIYESDPGPDQNGFGEISVFGELHVQVFAVGYLNGSFNTFGDSMRYSAPIDLRGSALPNQVDFVVNRSSRPEMK